MSNRSTEKTKRAPRTKSIQAPNGDNYNLQREQITPSEKAYAYKMKYDAIKKKAGRKNRYVLYCVKRYVQI